MILTLRQADEQSLSARTLAQERQAIREEFRLAADIEATGYEEHADAPDPTPPDHTLEIEHLTEVIDTATALLATILSHANLTAKSMEHGPFATLLAQEHPATADDIFTAAGWQLKEPSE